MGSEPMNEFEKELRQALEPRPAPPSLKRNLLQRRTALRSQRSRFRVVWWRRLAVAAALAGVLAGVLVWRHAEEQRRGEEVRNEVMTALRITSRALNQMQSQLQAHNRDAQNQNTDRQQ